MLQTQNNRSESLQRLQDLLQKLFRADAADLDFGIYRIINLRRDQLQDFIGKELPTIVKEALDANAEIESDHQEIEDLEQQIRQTLGDNVIDADGNLINENYKDAPVVKNYLEAKENLGSPQTRDQRSDNVFNHLYTFFSRYYDNGDFIPRRRYSQTERYAVPYNGEEVYLHWANRDQYYVKSGEHFSDYRFKCQSTTIIFDLQDVDIEKDNVKGDKRFFIPLSSETKDNTESDEVRIPFEYRPLTDDEKSRYGTRDQQDKIIDATEQEIIEQLGSSYNIQSELGHEIEGVTFLKKHLRTYTRRNTADFFIHKNLKQFLNQELDVFIKNEVIPMSSLIFDDVNFNDDDLKKVSWIETSKIFHRIAAQIIDFLAHIEEFQKRLWLKKKFVLSTDYCLTLDRVPEEFYPDIAENTTQLEEWKDLFAIHEIADSHDGVVYKEPLSVEFLKKNPNLVLDTCHFDSDFKDRLVASLDNLDNETDGLLIHGENFQVLKLLTEKYSESVKTIYIDPPYNTGGDDFLYKDSYQHSNWLSFIVDRVAVSHALLSQEGAIFTSIDDNEQHHLRILMDQIFGSENFLNHLAWVNNLKGRQITKSGAARTHESILAYTKSIQNVITVYSISVKKVTQLMPDAYKMTEYEIMYDEIGEYVIKNELHNTNSKFNEKTRPHLVFNIHYSQKTNEVRFTDVDSSEQYEGFACISPKPCNDGIHQFQAWRWGKDKIRDELHNLHFEKHKDSFRVYTKIRNFESTAFKDLITNISGSNALLKSMGLEFSNPKPFELVELLVEVSTKQNAIILDFFAGSGTTAHATINHNRVDRGNRKYILIEMGHHFDTALMPRIKKAVYAEKWKDAKPVSRDSRLSHIIKYQRIESYEDALNNIEFNGTEHEGNLFIDEHRLSYMLESETKGSPTFLNISELQNPFSYQLKIVKDMQTHIQTVDLPETFNYLLGLSVQTRQCLLDGDRRYLVYKGTVDQKSVVVIWRETADWEQKDFERDFEFIQEQKLTKGVTKVYVNTDSNIPEAKSLDPLFKQLMFSQ